MELSSEHAPALSEERVGPHAGNGREIVVIGAGVIGLSTANRLIQAGFKVTIIARDFPGPFELIGPDKIDYTSPWAGAHNRFIPPINGQEAREHAFALKTFHHMAKLVAEGRDREAGLTFMKGIEYLENPARQYLDLDEEKAKELGYKDFRLLPDDKLPDSVKWGCEYLTWCVNPMMYCCFLLRQFVRLGGSVVVGVVNHPVEVFDRDQFSSASVVINCSGFGFSDQAVVPTRGQLCLVANPCPVTITWQNADGSWVVAIPRGYDGGTVVGGTREIGNMDATPHRAVRVQMLANLRATYPAILPDGEEFKVLRDVVGRRPTREGGSLVECKKVEENRVVVHAYGLGGRGYECSWGVAEAVRGLLEENGILP